MSAREAIRLYAEAKSRGDVDAALRHCTADVVIDTYPFGSRSEGTEETHDQISSFLAVFPDYHVTLENLIEQGGQAVGWGTIAATMTGDFGPVPATGRRFTVPFTCVWDCRDGLIARERFYFDLNQICEQLGVSTTEIAQVLHAVNDMYFQQRRKPAAANQ